MADIKQITVGSTTYDIKDAKANIAYGTCSTAAATAAKVITVTDNASWSLTAGSIITVMFSNTNTAQNPTFNVNSTGAKNVYYGTSQITTSSLSYAGYKNRPMTFIYDGTQYRFMCWGVDNNTTYSNASLGQGYATCSTAEATTAKVGTLSSYALTTGGVVAVKFTYAVPASATLNINSKGAKAIYYKGAAITAGVIKAGDVATFIYNGSQYHLLTVDRSASEFVKSGSGAKSGLVPAPSTTAGTTKYLREDGTWAVPPDTNTTYTFNGAVSTIKDSNLTASRALVSDANGKVAVSAVTSTELGYLDGVTSAIQTQLNGKAASSHTHSDYMTKASPTGTGALSINRKSSTTVGDYSSAVGFNVAATGTASHAEGGSTTASGVNAHAEGGMNTASGDYSHSEGQGTTASGEVSHTEGNYTTASGYASHAEGEYTTAASDYQHVQGKNNIADEDGVYAHIVGNGPSDSSLSNAHTIDWDGNAWFAGDVYVKSGSGTNKDEDSVKLAPYSYGTTDLTAGTSPLATGVLYFVYE